MSLVTYCLMASSFAWNLTIDHSSPMFRYMPYGEGAASGGWATYYSISGLPQDMPSGHSSRITWGDESSMSMEFYGSAIYLYGETNCTYDVTIDDVPRSSYSPNGSLLVSFSNLTLGRHDIMIKPYPRGMPSNGFSIDKAVVTLHSTSSGPSNGEVYDNYNSSISYTGEWVELNDTSITSTYGPALYHQTQVAGSAASLEFYGDAVMIEGPLGRGNNLYDIVLEGTYGIQFFNASSWWTVGNTVLYYWAGLDPNKKHRITLINQPEDLTASTVSLNTITVFGSQSGKSDKPPVPQSNIVGAALAGYLILVLLLAALFAYLMKRYLHRNRDQASEGDLEGTCESKSPEHELGKLSSVSGLSLHSLDTSVESLPKYAPPGLSEGQQR